MKKWNRKMTGIAFSILFLLITTFALKLPKSGAYFSDYEVASGYSSIKLSHSSEMDESIDSEGNKHIVITNTGATDIWVRVRVFANAEQVEYECGSGWESEDGYFYYSEVLSANCSTSELKVNVKAEEADYHFEVIVIYESERIVYEGENPIPGWGR